MNKWRWENTGAFRDEVDGSNPETTSPGMVIRPGEDYSWYGSDGFRAKIEPLSCRQYKRGYFLAVRPLNLDKIIDKNSDHENWADPGAPSRGLSRPCDGNYNDNRKGGEDRHGGGKGTGKGKVTNDGKGKARGWGRETVKGNVWLNTPREEMLSLVPLICRCSRKCMRQTWTRSSN